MTIVTHAFSHMLRHSGEVLADLEHGDVLLERRDGASLIVGTVRRERAVRDGLDVAARVLATMLSDPALASRTRVALASALPWVAWLDASDQAEFADAFVRTAQACHDTDNYEPLARLLHRWKVSAQIVHDPELARLLEPAVEAPVPLARPTASPEGAAGRRSAR